MTERRRIVIDTDPGIDDAMAIAMALASPELEVGLVTSVFGNAAIDVTTRNALALLVRAGHTDIPVARGADGPIASQFLGPVPHIHGDDGLGGAAFLQDLELPDPPDTHAALELIKAAQSAKAENVPLTLVTLGPLTNLALALRLAPEFDRQIERVVVMGGNAFCPGNTSPAAEANILNDPEAADIVFGGRWPLTMIGLDVTRRVHFSGQAIDRLARADSFGGLVAREVVPFYRRFFERNAATGTDGIFVHDPSVIAWLLEPGLFETRSMPVRVETQGISRGKTWPAQGYAGNAARAPWNDRPAIDIAVEVDGEGVARLVEERMSAR